MNLTQFLLILRARYKIIALTLMLVVGVTLAAVLILPKTYTATTSLVLNYKGTDPVTGQALPSQLMPGYMATQIDIINSKPVALRVVNDLKLAESARYQQQFNEETEGNGDIRDWLANVLASNLIVEPASNSGVISISYKSKDPQFAAALANAFASAYQDTAVQLKIEPSKKATSYFGGQIKLLRDNFETAQRKLSKYQQDHDIDSADNRLDVETARLNDLSSQLVQVQGLAIDATSRLQQAQRNAGSSPDVMSSPVIQSLKGELLAAQTRFADISQRLSTNHPQYKSAKAEVDKLRTNLNQQIGQASASIRSNATIQRQREAEIRAALAAQREKVMNLNLSRDELKLLQNEVDAAQRAYEAASNRYTDTRLQAHSTQSDIAVLNQAVPPLLPTGPNAKLLLLLSFFLGSMLGLGLAIVMEILDRRLRSQRDLLEILNAPVLGVIKREKTSQPRLGFFHPSLQNATTAR
tara:strand:+ start:404006 stop:405412 length:1407 start_codon:yes stop_codon:yes gene_type:complete